MTNTDQNLETAKQPEITQIEGEENNPNLVHEDDTSDLEEIKNISMFASGVVAWHTDICNQANHVIGMPEQDAKGAVIEIKITSDKATDPSGLRTLDVSEHEAFKAGVRYVYDMFKSLPFSFLPTDADGKVEPEYASTEANESGEQA